MSDWADANLQEFEQRGLKYRRIVCTSFARSKTNPRLEEIYADMRLESRASVLSAIEECAAKSPIKIYETDKDWERLLKSVWNEFLNWVGKTFSWLNVDRAYPGLRGVLLYEARASEKVPEREKDRDNIPIQHQ
jgi:hypothetical protein